MGIGKLKKRLYGRLFVFWLSLGLLGCGRKASPPEIDFSDTVEIKEPSASKSEEISMCVGSMITPEEGYAYYKKLLEYVSRKSGLRVKFVERKTYAEINTLLKSGGIDVAFVCGGPYIHGREEFGLELLAAPQVDGKAAYYSYIIVAKDSPVERFEELRGRTFAFVDPMSNTGMLYPMYLLRQAKESPEGFFKNFIYTYSHDDSIKAVAEGLVDAAAVDSLVWQYLNKKHNRYASATRIINVSGPFGIPPVVAGPQLNPAVKRKIKDILLDMHTGQEGRDILASMFIDRFVEVDDSIYDGIREIERMLNR